MGRKRMKITDLRDKAGVAYGTAYALFAGKAKGIQFDTLAKLCRALDCQVGELFEFVPNGKESGDA
ncbi:MAG: helix-turn-helix domain-containing protein [Anaerolineae bacterium]